MASIAINGLGRVGRAGAFGGEGPGVLRYSYPQMAFGLR